MGTIIALADRGFLSGVRTAAFLPVWPSARTRCWNVPVPGSFRRSCRSCLSFRLGRRRDPFDFRHDKGLANFLHVKTKEPGRIRPCLPQLLFESTRTGGENGQILPGYWRVAARKPKDKLAKVGKTLVMPTAP